MWAAGDRSGEEGGGKAAYQQYAALAKDHPYYFEIVANPAEVAEDMALAVVSTNA